MFQYYDGTMMKSNTLHLKWGGRSGKWDKFCGDEKYNSMMEELEKK